MSKAQLAQTEITDEDVALVAAPVNLLQIAVQKGADISTIERLVALQEKMLARESEIQFNEAMNRVQSEIKRIAPDLDNPQTKSKYASYAAIDRAIRPIYSKEGLSLSFDTDDSPLAEHVRAVCYVSLGAHTRKYKVDMPCDGKGAKGGDVMTKTHASAAAMSYGMRYLVRYIFNIAIGAEDTDGNAVTMGDLAERLEFLDNCTSEEELRKLFTQYYREAKGANDQTALKALIAAKDKRLKELR